MWIQAQKKYNLVDRYQPSLVVSGALFAHLVNFILTYYGVIKQPFSQILFFIALSLGSILWMHIYLASGKRFRWDKEFVHIPVLIFYGHMVFGFFTAYEVRYALVAVWFSFYPFMYGNFSFLVGCFYSVLLSITYYLFARFDWYAFQAIPATEFVFVLGAFSIGLFLSIHSSFARLQNQSYRRSTEQLSQVLERLNYLSCHDPLTQIWNRRALNNAYYSDYQAVAVLAIDVDFFKAFNDRYGHLQGDQALQKIAAALKQALGSDGYLARYGGEEFMVLLYDVSPKQYQQIANRLQQAINLLRLPNHASPIATHITISIGGIFSFQSGTTLNTLWSEADKALYQAKRQGRNQIHLVYPQVAKVTSESRPKAYSL